MSVARRARHHAWSIPAALTLALALPAARGHAQEPAPRLRATLDGRELIGLSPDGRTILTRGPELTQGAKGVTLWDASTGQRRGTVRPGLGRVRPPLFSPDGSKLVLVSTEGEEDSFNVTLWEVKTGRKLGQAHVGTTVDPAVTFSPGGDEVRLRYIPGGEGPTRASGPIAVTRVDRLSAGEAADLAKIDQERRRTLVSEEASERARALLSGQPGLVISAAFAEDGRAMATHRRIGSLVVLDTETGRPRATLEAAEARVGPPLAISPDGTTLAVGRQGAGALLTLRDAATGRTKAELEVRPTGASALAFAPDGKTLAAVGRASPDATIRIWDVATGRERAALRGHEREIYCLAYAPDGGALASGAVNGTIRLWDPATGQPRMILKGMPGPVRALAFSPDGRTLASLPQFGPLTLWDVIAGRERARLADPRFGGGSTEVAALAFFADGQTLASAVHGGSVRL